MEMLFFWIKKVTILCTLFLNKKFIAPYFKYYFYYNEFSVKSWDHILNDFPHIIIFRAFILVWISIKIGETCNELNIF
jgi:hypothetical protein